MISWAEALSDFCQLLTVCAEFHIFYQEQQQNAMIKISKTIAVVLLLRSP